MNKKLAVAIIHGMGNQTQKGFQKTCDALMRSIGKKGVATGDIAYQPIYWADVLNNREDDYLDKAHDEGAFHSLGSWVAWNDLRAFVVDYLADVAAYQRVSTQGNQGNTASGTYTKIHEKVRDGISSLRAQAGEDVPLIVMAHSLGGHIMSSYIWDIQKNISVVDAGRNGFESMNTLAGIVTFGCNIPLFTFAYDSESIKPISFPQLAGKAGSQQKKWINVYDADDILGYPLNTLGKYREAGFCKDILINSGGLLTSWNPLSHARYWTDDDFVEIAADFLNNLL